MNPKPITSPSPSGAAQNSKGTTLWFFGLPSAGKTTLAGKVVRESAHYVLLDGDEVRQTVGNFDMGQDARLVHLSYMAFCCRQLNDCGISVAAAFVTPLERHRARIKEILENVEFVWLRCAAETCAKRDPKGLWKRAAAGTLPHFTGAGGAWEDPAVCALSIQTDMVSVEEAYELIKRRFGLTGNGK